MRKNSLILTAIILLSIITSSTFAAPPQIQPGLTWLNSAQTTTGNWPQVVTSEYHSTAAALDAAYALEPTSSTYTTGLAWLGTQVVSPTDYLSRRIIALKRAGQDVSNDVNTLLQYHNPIGDWVRPDGGWGGDAGYVTATLDTAIALQALTVANYTNKSDLYYPVNYLRVNQNADGGWGVLPGGDSNVFVTATVLKALSSYLNFDCNARNTVAQGVAYLLTKQNPDGGFGSSPSTVYETAVTFDALIASNTNLSSTYNPLTQLTADQAALRYLTTTQSPNGSWNDDPYSTALALTTLANIRPNLAIAPSDITLSKNMPQAGESITITALIKNVGFENTSGVVARFYQGDPTAGGVQIGTDQLIPSLAIGASSSVSIHYTFTGTGSRTIFVAADPDSLISETTKIDNKASAQLWVATIADLAVFSSDLKPSTYTPASGTAFTLEYTVRNLGESGTDGFDVAVYDGTPSGVPIQTGHISGIGGTEIRTGTIGITLTGDGPHTLYVVADPANAITETTKTNNTGSVTVQVGGSQSGADLVVSSADITLIPARPHAGDTVTIVANVRNQGTQSADNFTVEMYDGAPDQGGILFYTQNLTLAAGAQQSVTGGVSVSSGIHTIYVVLDRTNQTIETSETNNTASVSLMTDMVDLSLSATDLVFVPSQPVAGDSVVFNITAHNRGIANTGPFNLALYDGDPNAGGSLLQVFPIPNIPGDGSVTQAYSFIAQPRVYRFYAVTDPDNQVNELSKDNNMAIRSVTIKNPGELLGPDLVPIKMDITDVTTDSQTLAISGNVHVTFQNKGDDRISTPFNVIIYDDKDGDGKYTAGVDMLLGTATNSMTIWPGGANMLDVPLSGTVKFLHSPLYVFVDSGDVIKEQDEINNVMISCKDCEVTPTDRIQPVVKWSSQGLAGSSHPTVATINDTNGDGKINENDVPAVIFAQYINDTVVSSSITALQGDTGSRIFSVNTTNAHFPPFFVAVGDIDNDGFPEIVINKWPNTNGGVGAIRVLNHDGTLKWDNEEMVKAWNAAHPTLRAYIDPNTMPVIADMDNDGVPEIIASTTVINNDGSIRSVGIRQRSSNNVDTGRGGFPGVWYTTTVADLDLDGKPKIIAGNTAYNSDGTIKWFNTMLPDGITAVGNFNDEPYPEIVLVGVHGLQLPGGGVIGGPRMYLLDHNGNVIWGPIFLRDLQPDTDPSIGLGGPPVIADFDGDGEMEIGFKGFNKYFILDRNGNVKQTLPISYVESGGYTGGFSSAPTVFDLNGDGHPEVIINSDGYFRIFDGKTGTLLYKEKFGANWNSYMNAIVADIDGDGHAEIVAIGYGPANSKGDIIRVYGSDTLHGAAPWVGARKIWNDAKYHITNVKDDGSIPQHEPQSWLLNNTYLCQAPTGTVSNPFSTANPTASLLRSAQTATSVDLTVRVGNGGAVTAPSGINITFYDGDPLASGVVLGSTATTKILQIGEYQDISFSTNDLTLGLHNIFTVVNSGASAIPECNKDDNQTHMDFTVKDVEADLKIGPEDIVLPAAPYYEGSVIPITAGIRNLGSVAASNVTVKLYLGNPSSGGIQVGSTQTIASLAASGSTNVIFNFDTLGKAGTNVLYIVLDQENAVTESDKTNNMAGVTITVQSPQFPNLTITTDNIQTSPASGQQGQVVTITATVTNRGTAVGTIPIQFSIGDPTAGGTVFATQTIFTILNLGQTATVTATLNTTGLFGQQTVFVTIDPGNSIIESLKTDNTASRPLFIQSAGLTSTVGLDKAVYQRDETVNVAVTISNTTAQLRNLSLNLSVIDSVGNNIAVISTADPVTINPNSSITLTRTWNTGTTLAGNYFVTAEVAEDGRVISNASAGFSITQDKAIDAKVTTDKISYSPNQIATLTSTITSKSANYIMENLSAKLTIGSNNSNGSNTPVYTETKAINTLMPGAGYTFKTYWSIATNPSGTYPVTLEVRDAANAIVATATQYFVITSNVQPSGLLRGQIALDRQVLLSGETATINYTVTNVGNIDLTGVTLSVMTVSVDEQTVYDTLTDTASLIKGATYPNTKLLNTGKYGAKDYLVVLRANINGNEDTLAGTYLRIEGAPTAPSLNAPTDGKDVLTFTPDLVVNNASDPNDDRITYQFELYSDSALTKLEATSGQLAEGTGTTTWTMPFTLTENQTYYWRARAFDGWLYGPWMATASLRVNTVNEPPTAPMLLSPADTGIVSALTPTLTITNATDPDSANLTYNIDVALDPDFTQIVATVSGLMGQGAGVTSWQVPVTLLENMNYYWRAQADDWFLTGPWSSTFRFFVNTVNTAPTTPVITAPVNGANVSATSVDIALANSIDPDSSVITYNFEADITPTFDSSSVIRSGAVTQGQGSTTWNLSGLTDNAHYFVRAKASDGQADSPWSGVITFFANTANDPPTAPVIANPSNGGGVNTTTPTLSVQNATDPDGDALTYEFALYADSGMTALVASASNITETPGTTAWIVPVTLIENQNYYWRARAFDGKAYGNWSMTATFMVNGANLGPGAPTILSPLDNGSVGTLKPVLTIANAANPSHAKLTYEFEVYKDGTVISHITNVSENSTGTTSITISTSLTDNTVYQWKVRAFDGDRYGPWTPLSTFTVHLPHASITVDIEFEPETLNKNSHGTWVLVKIELPHGYKAEDVDLSSIRLEGTVHAELWPHTYHHHHHQHGCQHDRHGHHHEVLMVKFKRSEVIAVLPEGRHVPVHVTGTIGSTPLEGVDVIRVTSSGNDCGGH